MASIVAELQKLVTPALVSEVSRQTHEPNASVHRAYGAAIPALAAILANRSHDPGFVNHLVDLATSASADRDPEISAMRLASSPTGIDITTPMGGWMSAVFGANLSGVTNSLARYAGIRESAAATLLLTCAPLVLGYLGRFIRSHNLSANTLAERLQQERSHIALALPPGFAMPGINRQQYEKTRTLVSADAPRRESRWDTWVLPLTLRALVAVLGVTGVIWWAQASLRHRQPPRATVETIMPNAVGTTGSIDRDTRALRENLTSAFPAGSTEERLASYLASPGTGSINIDLDRVTFEPGSAKLLPNSKPQVDNIGAILLAEPTATVAVAGHTDNAGIDTGDLALSRARAETIAEELRNAGVAAGRIRVEADTSHMPAADNATKQGLAQNGHVTLEVTR
jgi:outer membrane protein OmpA-like peptidoglycan-associated protein